MNKSSLLDRIDQLLGTELAVGERADRLAIIFSVFQGTLTLATTLYGAGGPQEKNLMEAAKIANGLLPVGPANHLWPVVMGTLRAMRADVDSGLVGNLQRQAAGEVLGDMLGLAKEALAQGDEPARNVAAVLVAATFEDTIRRMGESLGGVTGRPTLDDVIAALKRAGVLVGASLTTALAFLKFRNDALHADWKRLDHSVIGSCLSFTEGLLVRHFS